MIAKQIIRAVLLIVVLGGLAIWANRAYRGSNDPLAGPVPAVAPVPEVKGSQVVMTYFISGERCSACQTIESLAKETAEREFAGDLASSRLVFRVIDTGKPGNGHFVKDYQLTSKMVILSHRVDGRETGWKAMEKVWDLLDDPAAYRAYLAEGIREYLKP